ncbi:MAG TPA: DNA translocase FtsK 4TM domain-containing protein [Candidatus Saccharimonadales bacterium]|nr:DNA translocase FtsK 4TM domain-containing protein [Candidatus Saccharimonadales bacterium]
MPKKKKRSARSKKNGRQNRKAAPKHSLPDGFWPQVTALILVILALMLTLGMMSSGGPLPEATWNLGRYLLGWAAFILPILFVFRAVQVFRAEDNLVPKSVSIATIIFAILAGGFVQLMSQSPANLALAQAGNGGGVVGWLVAKATMLLVSAGVGALIVFLVLIVTSLFVLSISPDKLLMAVVNLFKRDMNGDTANATIAAKVKADDPVTKGEFKLNEGVPTTMSSDETKSASKLSTFRDSIKPDKAAEDQAALTSSGDPDWQSPSLDLLEKKQNPADAGDVKHNAQIIKDTLAEFNIEVEMEGANIGPKVTQYTLRPPSGVKLTRITALETNIALNLAAQALRIEAPIPGQRAVGIEVPNRKAADVRLYGILSSKQWQSAREPLSFAIGKDISGDAVVGELNKMPHLMIAGQTGSGKSVMINTLLSSLLYRNSPSDMRLILVDPKQVEMAPYEDIPHLLTPIITEPEKCISALKWAVNEMERRYSLLAEEKLRDIASYNRKKKEEAMPYVVIVIDELADLMMVAARDVEQLIVRLAQKARAVGIHLVLATQRPSVNVITGLIKANIPARIAFTVASQVDSRTILDQIGAEKLLGQGDMLMLTPQMSKPKRIQGAWVTDEEVGKITDHLRMQRPPQYDEEIIAEPVQLNGKGGIVMDMEGTEDSEYQDAVRVVIDSGKASTSYLQRRLRIGYSKASRIMDMMEEQGIIGPADGSRPRDVLVSSMDDVMSSEDVA